MQKKLGIIWMTILFTVISTAVTLTIVGTAWWVFDQPNKPFALMLGVICPLCVAPPVVYTFSRLSHRLARREKELALRNRDLLQALSQVQELRGLLPICSCCRKVRDDQGYWTQLESYISAHSKAEFSHGLCPECGEKVLADMENRWPWLNKKKS